MSELHDSKKRRHQEEESNGNTTEMADWQKKFSAGDVCYMEYVSSDVAGTAKFYNEAFGWDWQTQDMGAMEYKSVKFGDKFSAGLRAVTEHEKPSTVSYVLVPNLDEATKKCKAAGGQVIVPRTAVEKHGWFVFIMTPGGVVQALWENDPTATTNASAPSTNPDCPIAAAKAADSVTSKTDHVVPPAQVRLTTVYCTDYDKAVEFWTKKFGYTVLKDAPYGEGARWIEFGEPGRETVYALMKDAAKVGGHGLVCLVTADLDKLYNQLVARGVEFKEAPTMQSWGEKMAIFYDQDKNWYSISENDQEYKPIN